MSGPAEPEKADGDAEGADKGGGQSFLGLYFAVGVELRFYDFVEVEEEGRNDEDGTYVNIRY